MNKEFRVNRPRAIMQGNRDPLTESSQSLGGQNADEQADIDGPIVGDDAEYIRRRVIRERESVREREIIEEYRARRWLNHPQP